MTDSAIANSIRQTMVTELALSPPSVHRYLVAYSGGLDSAVLLHALVSVTERAKVRAVYVDHDLHPDSASWAKHCRRTCEALGIEFRALQLRLPTSNGESLEALARSARYAALAAEIDQDEALLTAHHQRDQAETMLLAALRGAGMTGLAAMPALLERGNHVLLRPLLRVPATDLQRYARAVSLEWIDDPSNADLRFDRNYLRQAILPLLRERWPGADRTLSRSAELCAEASHLLDELAVSDLGHAVQGDRLAIEGLQALPADRQRNALRCALARLGLAMPSAAQLEAARRALLESRPDARPLAAWPGVRIRRYGKRLWFFTESTDPPAASAQPKRYTWDPLVVPSLQLGGSRGRLSLDLQASGGFTLPPETSKLTVAFRRGGERLRPATGARERTLKNLLQESQIVPWMRGNIPLLYAGEQLLAVGDLWINAEFAVRSGEAGVRLVWQGHALLN